jgi:hypothetical protein
VGGVVMGRVIMGRMAMSMGVPVPMIVLVYARRAVHQPALKQSNVIL